MTVEIFEQEFFQHIGFCADFVGKSHQRAAEPCRLGVGRRCARKVRRRRDGDVHDQRVDHSTDRFRHCTALRDRRPFLNDLVIVPCESRHALQLLDAEQARSQAIVDVVIVVGDLVGQVRQLRFERRLRARDEALSHIAKQQRMRKRAMLEYSFARFKAKVQAIERGIALLELVDHTQALEVVLKAPGVGGQFMHAGIEFILAGVTEGRMAKVMRERDRFGQVLVEPQAPGQHPGDLGDFQGVRQARTKQVAFVVDENLRLVLQPAKGPRMHDTVAIALEFAAVSRRRLRITPSPCLL